MPLIATEAIVLHAFNYLESSRIVRLATRDAGLVSVVARGARRPKSAFGALDLFTHGVAQISLRPERDLHTLTGFDVGNSRASLGTALPRFAAAAMLTELVLRFGHEESGCDLFVPLANGLDLLQNGAADDAVDVALRAAWQLVGSLGFTPTLDDCAMCHAAIAADAAALFDLRAGGVLCADCGQPAAGRRTLPPSARDAIRVWLAGEANGLGDHAIRKAHQRLLREFLAEHLTDGRPLTAFSAWEAFSPRTADSATP
ncbi:MAG: DNA repair protein RecO [Gemmatimonadaceae bacterium]